VNKQCVRPLTAFLSCESMLFWAWVSVFKVGTPADAKFVWTSSLGYPFMNLSLIWSDKNLGCPKLFCCCCKCCCKKFASPLFPSKMLIREHVKNIGIESIQVQNDYFRCSKAMAQALGVFPKLVIRKFNQV
jgi:hypothetical protein